MTKLRAWAVAVSAVMIGGFTAVAAPAEAAPASLPCADPMVMTFDTTLDPSTNATVGFVLSGGSGTVTVDWGGGGSASPVGAGTATDQVQSYPADPGLVEFSYSAPGSYTVSVCASAQGFSSPQTTTGPKFSTLTAVSSFGSVGITDYSNAFLGATHLTAVPASLPSGVTDVRNMFKGATGFDGDVTRWSTSTVTTMSGMFEGDTSFNQDLGSWDVSGVTDMTAMFSGVKLSTSNYDNLLTGWAAQHLHTHVAFDAGTSTYSTSGAAARETLTGTDGWSITDGGQAVLGTIAGSAPTITGTLAVDHTLTATPGTWTPSGVGLAYQWYRSGTPIGGATSPQLALDASDVGATLTVAVTGSLPGYPSVTKTSAATAAVGAGGGGSFVSVAPTRLLDTRTSTGAGGPVPANGTIHVQIAGRGGVPATGVSAVVVNLTETDASRGGYITAYPDGTPLPTSSTLNFPAGDTRANLAVVKLGTDGKIALTNTGVGTVHLVADLTGYYLAGTPAAAGAFAPLNPTRILDTRTSNGASGPVAANGIIHVQVTGRGGIPATGVSAVVLNLTETAASGGGYLTVYPDGTPLPGTSNLNFPRGDTRAALVTVEVGGDGKIAVANRSGGSVQIVGDVAGYYLASSATTPGTFTPLAPARVLDTRFGNGAAGPVPADGTIQVQITGRGGVPSTGVSAVVLNVTETGNRRGGYVTAYPNGSCEPNASTLNLPGGGTRANLAVMQVGSDGKIALTSHNGGTVQLVADVAGYFTPNTIPAVAPTFQSLAQDAIATKYAGLATQLGTASGGLIVNGCTAQQNYATGSIVYTNRTGAHAVYGPIYSRYTALGGYSHTGVPTTDVTPLANYSGGQIARFTHGALVSSDHGVRWLTPEAADSYLAGGAGKLGAPITDTTTNGAPYTGDTWTKLATPGQTSASSMLYRNASAGTYWVHGAIYHTWASLNYAAGPLGRPLSNEYSDGVTMQAFTTGRIMRGTSGWPAVYGDVWRTYSNSTHHAATGDLGLPTGAGNYYTQDFQNARIDHGRIRVRANATTHNTTSAEVQYTYHSGCPVGPSALRTITMNYLGFDNRVHRGVMIVRYSIAGQVIDSFSAAAWNSFQIRQMVNPNYWYGDDYKMMAADNTSAFNCRKVSGNPYALSPHSYGTAIDINDFENPYEELGVWYPYKNWYATHRDASKPGVLVASSTLTSKLVNYGFYWGAWWSQPDYQHFQK